MSILDLDPKPFDSILYQLRLDQKIVSFYLKTCSALPEGSVSPHPICPAQERGLHPAAPPCVKALN